MAQSSNSVFNLNHYLFRRKVFKLFGGAFHAYDESGQVIFYSEQKAFKLREDFRIFSDESKSRELLRIQTPQILDIGATYNVFDSSTSENVGAIKRKGLKSIIRDEWLFFDASGRQVGMLSERSQVMAILTRFINLIPQQYGVSDMQGIEHVRVTQHFNPFILKYTVDFANPALPIDRRLILAACILLCGIEGRQD